MLLDGFLTLYLAAALVPATVCDYQLEVNLISYNNSARRLADGSCCDLEGGGGVCLPQDTCDVRLTFSIQNFVTGMTFHRQTKVLGTYVNTDMITFPNCSTLMNNERNPLIFIVPTNQWSAGQQLRLLIVIHDVDRDPITGAPVQETIQESFPLVEISRPSAPNATFTNTQTFSGANSLTLTYQYRVICSASTCGSDCSQTTNCQPFPSCVPITCANSPCLNGGTCSNVPGGGYNCSCGPQCSGENCGTCDDPCAPPNPCFNGGTCTAHLGLSFTCTCRQGFTGATCMEMAPTGTTTDSNMPTTDGSMNQITNTDSGISDPNSALPMATTKEDTQTSAGGYTAALVSWSCILLLTWSTVLLLFP